MLLMLWSRLDQSRILCIILDHYQVIFCFNYIKLLFYQFLITVTMFGNPLWYHFQKPLEHLHSRFLQHNLASTCNSFIKLALSECWCFHSTAQVFEVLHHLSPGYLRNWFEYAEAYTGHGGQKMSYLTLNIYIKGCMLVIFYCCNGIRERSCYQPSTDVPTS